MRCEETQTHAIVICSQMKDKERLKLESDLKNACEVLGDYRSTFAWGMCNGERARERERERAAALAVHCSNGVHRSQLERRCSLTVAT